MYVVFTSVRYGNQVFNKWNYSGYRVIGCNASITAYLECLTSAGFIDL